MKDRLRKFGATALLMLAMFTFSSAALLAPKTALAIPVENTADAPRIGEWILNALKYLGQTALVASVSTALINTVTYATDRLAYDAAVYIAAGGNGEDPLFDNRTPGEYFADYGASVAGEALGSIDDTGILGNFSLCEPNASGVTLAFKFGIQSAFDRPKPACEWSDVRDNWDSFRSEIESMSTDPFGKNSLITTKLSDMYNPKSNDLSVGIQLYSDVLNKAQTDAANNTLREMFGGFFKDKTDFITGRVETPAELIQKRLDATMMASDSIRNQIAVQALGDKEILLQVAKHAGSVFTNTLLSKVTEKLYDGLFGGLDQTAIDPFNIDGLGTSSGEDARQSFRSFLTAVPLSVENYSQLQEFSACPSSGKSLYNCVADSSLVTAVSRADSGSALTIAEAIEEGLLNGSWPLIPSSDTARDQDPFCYTYGYCHGNLVKLRKARIISTGWEIAAESSANSENSPVTLSEVVDAFNTCNDQGELDDSNPWCHLIDPNWVLKYPETQCKALVYGEQLVASVTDQRQEVCVDMPSCIDEDGDGNCTGGYGYCVREENVWRFRGEECPDYYASCTAYEDTNGESFDFLSNTTNSDNCTADSAGCLWYATQKEDDGSGTFDFPNYASATDFAAAEAATDIYRNRIYFTSEVADCEASGAGCKELVSRADGVTLNMINNPSFEDDVDNDGVPDGWVVNGTDAVYSDDASSMLGGTDAVNPHAGIFYQAGIVLSQGAEYTYSIYARQGSGSGAATSALLSLSSSDGEAVDFGGFALSGDCSVFATDDSIIEIIGTPSGTDYERFACTFTVPTMSDSSAEITAFVDMMGGDLFFDNVQLEQESSASSYHEGYSSDSLDLEYVKVAPSYLGCTGDSATDPEDCANYATMCLETDVGCSLYTPTNGDPSIAGITDALDVCPEACVGYDTFKQEATLYEPDGDFPVYFIPDSADECSAQAVGCDEFTNIATEAASYFTDLRACLTSDQAELNASTSDDSAVFYTWEGSDTAGYQLKTWNLMESDIASTYAPYVYSDSGETDAAPQSAPCTSWSATATGITCNDDSVSSGKLDTDSADCDQHDDTITNPDCREFYDASGIIHYRLWSQTVTVDASCVTYRKTSLVGLGSDNDADGTDDGEANCEGSGGYFDTTTSECRYYGYAEESTTCSEKQSGCREYTGGRSRNSRQALTEYFEEGDLTNWDAANATDVTLSNESIATDGHSLSSDGESVWTFVGSQASTAICTEASTGEGCESEAGALGGTCTIGDGEYYCGTLSEELYAGKTYTISFWAKGTGTLSIGFDSVLSGVGSIDPTVGAVTSTFADAIALDTDWNEYSYGPLDMNSADHPDFGEGASALVFTPSSGGTFYIDNVVLREGEDNITVIKDSWVTPAECDETAEDTSSPQYMLGCQEYTDQNGDVSNLKSFHSLCEESQVGCSAYFLTQESDATSAAVYGGYCNTIDGEEAPEATSCYYTVTSGSYDTTSQYLCTIGVGTINCEFNLDWYVPAANLPSHLSYAASTVVSPADKDVFLVVNDDVECASDVAGCMEVGLPVFSQDHTSVASWTATYLMNIPADYETTLCSEKELFCDAWVDGDGSTSYFRNPQDQTCDYRTDVTIDNVSYSGWFKTGDGDPELCATDSTGAPQYVIGGDISGIWKNGDADYNNWVGTCLTKYDSCSEFQDLTDLPSDEVYGDTDGTSYYYLNNDSLEDNSLPDSQKCNGQVSQKEGCGLFNDTSEPSKTYNMSASYVASKHANTLFGGAPNGMADPIDCDDASTTITTSAGDSVDLCASRCWYDAEAYYDINGTSETFLYDGSCYDDSDCRPLKSESNETITGFCASAYDADGDGDDDAAPRLENDANVVLKVNRDRECSEWLSCSDAQTTWDERTNSYKTICGDIGLCTEYSTSGNASFCSAWKSDEPAVVLDIETYSERDVSWYGDDYSGYAIPDTLPVDQLTQKNVAAPSGTCNTASSSDSTIAATNGDECTSDADCGVPDADTNADGVNDPSVSYTYCPNSDESDYRLAYVAGACTGDYGDDCSIGYCENTGSPCATSDSCGTVGGLCLIGTCYDVSTTLCASSADCSTGDICSGGYCATEGANVDIDTYEPLVTSVGAEVAENTVCGTSGSLYTSVNYKVGTCMRDECVLTPTGSTFDVATAEVKSCRAYPEINSPFPNAIVSTWEDDGEVIAEGSATAANVDAIAVSHVQNFENAKTCILGEDCDCSYKKATYGGVVRYFNMETEFPFETTIGVCSGGDYDGQFCGSSSDYDDSVTTDNPYQFSVIMDTTCSGAGGSCTYRDQVDDVLGMDGYCLERDSSTNILGDRDQNACLTWLPVDQLQGSTDLYAKYTSAGYTGGDTNYCSFLQPYVNLGSSYFEAGNIDTKDHDQDSGFGTGCIEFAGQDSDGDSNDWTTSTGAYQGCVTDNPEWRCPMGYYAIVGRPVYDNSDGEPQGEGYSANVCNNGGADPDCPFMCVPLNAGTTAEGGECSPPSGWDTATQTVPATYGVSGEYTDYEVPVYFTDSFSSFDSAASARADCWARGVQIYAVSQDNLDQNNCGLSGATGGIIVDGNAVGFAGGTSSRYTDRDVQSMNNAQLPQDCWTSISAAVPTAGWYNLAFSPSYYLGCSDLVQTEDSDNSGDEGAPWTDRLLNPNDTYQLVTSDSQKGTDGSSFGTNVDADKFTYSRLTEAYPYGRVDTTPSAVSSDPRPASVPACTTEVYEPTYLDYYRTFTSPTLSTDGTTMSCDVTGSVEGTYFDQTGGAPEARAFVDYFGIVYYGGDQTGLDDNTTELEYFGLDSAYNGTEAGYSSPVDGLIDRIFATRVDTYSFEDGFDPTDPSSTSTADGYFSLGNGMNYSQYWDVRVAEGTPPSVWAVDVDSCYNDECEEDLSHGLTLNDQNEGDVSSEDFYRAYLKFYAAADKNQLPIRRVIVDWGDKTDNTDQSGSDAPDNFYKNHRGLNPGEETSICDNSTLDPTGYEWGMTPESCEAGYFSYNHIYTCNPSGLLDCADTSGDGIYDNTPCTQDSGLSCTFRPRVHVLDNWGFCAGTCDSTLSTTNDDDTASCFNSGTTWGSTEAANECDYASYPSEDYTGATDPWVYYDGTITVTP